MNKQPRQDETSFELQMLFKLHDNIASKDFLKIILIRFVIAVFIEFKITPSFEVE